MSRMNRHDWRDRYAALGRPKAVPQDPKSLMRAVRRDLVSKGLVVPRSALPPKYVFSFYDEWTEKNYEVIANTAGEARALIKQQLGFKKRLSQFVTITDRKDNPARASIISGAGEDSLSSAAA